MSHGLDWFEGVCDLLSKNPTEASSQLLSFRESAHSLDARHYLINSTSPSVKFQAASILHYVFLLRWDTISLQDKASFRETLWALIDPRSNTPLYVSNKLLQVLVATWKRGWLEESAEFHGAIIQQISCHLAGGVNGAVFTARLMRIFLEEFNAQCSSEKCLSFDFHAKTHGLFEKSGLYQLAELSLSVLSTSLSLPVLESLPSSGELDILSIVDNNVVGWTESIDTMCVCVGESCKLLVALLSWEFGNVDVLKTSSTKNAFKESTAKDAPLLMLPEAWAVILLQPTLIEKVFTSYDRLRRCYMCLQTPAARTGPSATAFRKTSDNILSSMVEVRSLMQAFGSITGPIFAATAVKVQFGNFILEKLLPFLHILSSKSGAGVGAVPSRLRNEEFESFGYLIQRLFQNFRFSLMCQMALFGQLLLALGTSVYVLAEELSVLSETQMHQLTSSSGSRSRDDNDMDGCGDIFGNWRGDVISLLLETWVLIIEHPDMLLHTNVMMPMGDGCGDETPPIIAIDVKISIQQMNTQVFQCLYETMRRSTICDVLTTDDDDDEENEEIEAIITSSMVDLLTAICTLGRSNFCLSLAFLSEKMKQTTGLAYTLLQQDLQKQPLTNQQLHTQCMSIMESWRICLMFMQYLFLDNTSSQSDDCATFSSDGIKDTYDVSRRNVAHPSGEAAVIPINVMDSCYHTQLAGVADYQGVIRDAIAALSLVLQIQQQVISTPMELRTAVVSAMSSPLLIQSLFQFFAEYLDCYVNIDASLYDSALINQHIPALFQLRAGY